MEVTEAPSVHRATELVCQICQPFIYKAFTPKYLSLICMLHLRCSLCRRHLCNIGFTSVPSVTLCALYVRVLVYHSIFRMNLFFIVMNANSAERNQPKNTFIHIIYQLLPLSYFIVAHDICPYNRHISLYQSR